MNNTDFDSCSNSFDYEEHDEDRDAFKKEEHSSWTSKMLVKVIAVVAMIFAGIFAYQTLN
jgi:hypothetical protein